MKNYTWHSPKLSFTIFTIISILILSSFGFWQVERLVWKRELIEKIENANSSSIILELPNEQDKLKTLAFRKAKLTGVFLNEHEFHITPRSFRGKLGYHINTPFKLKDGRIILINRGWVVTELKKQEARLKSIINDEVTIDVQFRLDKDYTKFTPKSSPEDNIWFHKDYENMSKHSGLQLLNIGADVIGEQNRDVLPIPSTGEIKIRNDHFEYILTWFGIAIGIFFVYFFGHFRQRADAEPKSDIVKAQG